MRLKRFFAVALAAASLTAPAVAMAQDVPEPPGDSDELLLERLDISNHPEINLTVSLPEELASDPAAIQFTVLEAGNPVPVTISEVPTDNIAVVLIIDTSGSMQGTPIAEAKAAALSFLEEMPFGTQAALVTFGNSATLVKEFTSDAAELAEAIRGISTGGNTALYDGLALGLDQFAGLEDTRNTVVLLSDGADTASALTLIELEERLVVTDVAYHAIELKGTENDPVAMRALAEAAHPDAGESRVVSADDPEALTGVLNELATAIVNQFSLTFESASFDATELEVVASANGQSTSLVGIVEYPEPPPVTETVPPTSVVSVTPTTVVAPVATVAPALREGFEVQLGLFDRPGLLYTGLGMMFVSLATIVFLSGIGQPRNVQLVAKAVSKKFGETKGKTLSSLAEQATLFADRSLEKGERRGVINTKLEAAGLSWRPAEFVVLTGAAMLGAMAVGFATISGLAGLGLAVFTVLGIYAFLSQKASKRRSTFAAQLPDALQLMAGSLRSGFGLMQAVDTVANEIADPAGEEFRRVKLETHLGRDSDEALKAMAHRLQSEDFRWVVEAIEIHREVGGDLGEILDSVTDTVRDRNRIRRRVKSLSAEGRFSGVILGSLPVFLVGALMMINPDYLLELFESTMGQIMVAAGLLGMVVGVLWMRKITKLEY